MELIKASAPSMFPRVAFRTNKRIVLSKLLCELLDLKKGDRVSFFYDKERPMDWYIGKDENGLLVSGFETRNSMCLTIYSKEMIDLISVSIGMKPPYYVRVSDSPTKEGYFALITKSAKRHLPSESD